MQESEDQYRILFEANPFPMWVVDVQTFGFLAVNHAAVEHYGYTHKEFLSLSLLDIRPVEDIPLLKQVLARYSAGPDNVTHLGVWRHRKKDGTIIEVDVSSRPLIFEGHPARLAMARDVTEQKRSTEQLRLLQACVNRLSDVAAIMEAEPEDGGGPRIIFVNDAFVRKTGYSREEALGRNPSFLQGPKSSQAAFERIDAALKGGQGIREELIKFTKGGREIWWEAEITPVTDETGRCRYFVAIERDVTERKRAERALRRSEARLKEAQRVANIGSWEWNVAERKVMWSDELYRIFGLAPQSVAITLQTFLNCIHPAEREAMLGKIEQMRRRPKSLTETFRIVRPDGSMRWVMARGEVAGDGAPNLFRIVGTVQDITERREAEEARVRTAKLEAANKELEAFSYSVSHDLRAPLRAIDGFTKLLAEDCGASLGEEGRGYLGHIQEATRRMGQLIQDLLELSRISTSEMRRIRVDLSALVEDIVQDLRQTETGRPMSITITPVLMVDADPRLLRIALENLLDNAWKFTGKTAHPHLEFGVIQKAEPVYFVRDNGAGFDMESADRLFSVFQRLHLETEFTGTGVGLATVQRIINRHGGRIWAEAAVDKGATFYFTLGGGSGPVPAQFADNTKSG
jgi:PAS domain S-box-containing protein